MFSYQGLYPYHVYPCRLYRRQSYLLAAVLMMAALLLATETAYAANVSKGKASHVIVSPELVVLKEISDRVEALGTARATESVI